MADLPTAIINGAKSWLRPIGSLCTVAAFVGLGYGVTQFGCRNSAITYAKALDPQASCNAVVTSIDRGEQDEALCRMGGFMNKCFSRYDSGFVCVRVQ